MNAFINEQSEIDFIFLDDAGVPFRVKDIGDKGTWLCTFNAFTQDWVTSRLVTFSELFIMQSRAIPEEEALLYHTEKLK